MPQLLYPYQLVLATLLAIFQTGISSPQSGSSGPVPRCEFVLNVGSTVQLGKGTRIQRVGQVVFPGNDRFFVSAGKGPGVDVFSGDGSYLWSVARSFDGPIEVRKPGSMTTADYSVQVIDDHQASVLNLDFDGDQTDVAQWRSGNWASFITSSYGYIGYRKRPSRQGVLESSEDSGLLVPQVFSDAHSQAILLEYPLLPLLAGSVEKYYFAFPGTPVVFQAYGGRIQRSNRLHDIEFKVPDAPYQSFFAAELDRVTGRLAEYVASVSRIVAVYELKDYVVVVTAHDWKEASPEMTTSVFTKGLRYLGSATFSVGMPEMRRRVPVGSKGNSIIFVVDPPQSSRDSNVAPSAEGSVLVEYELQEIATTSLDCLQ